MSTVTHAPAGLKAGWRAPPEAAVAGPANAAPILVDSNTLEDERILAGWLALALGHMRSLPPK